LAGSVSAEISGPKLRSLRFLLFKSGLHREDKPRDSVNELEFAEAEQDPKPQVQQFHVLEQKETKETKKILTVIYA
jgi:hypothetical protein